MPIIMSSKKGFVLIEIIVSVMLLSIVGIALLKVNSNQKNIYNIAHKKLEFSKYVSLLSNQHSEDLHGKEINLYDTVKSKYNIKDNLLIKILKNKKVKYSQDYKSVINLNLDENTPSINLLIDEIKLSDKKGTSTYLTVKL